VLACFNSMGSMRVCAGVVLAVLALAACSSATPTVPATTAGTPAGADVQACAAVHALVSAVASKHQISGSQLSDAYSTGERAISRAIVRDARGLQKAITSSNAPGTTRSLNDLVSDCSHLGLTS